MISLKLLNRLTFLSYKALNKQIADVVFSIIFALSVVLLSFDKVSLLESVSGVATCINNVGPAFERLGATGNFSYLSNLSKIVLCFDMLLGRLEIFPMLALLSPSVWKR